MVEFTILQEFIMIISGAITSSAVLVGIMPLIPSNRQSRLVRWTLRLAILASISHIGFRFFSTGNVGVENSNHMGIDLMFLVIEIGSFVMLGAVANDLFIVTTRNFHLTMSGTVKIMIYGIPLITFFTVVALAQENVFGLNARHTIILGLWICVLEFFIFSPIIHYRSRSISSTSRVTNVQIISVLVGIIIAGMLFLPPTLMMDTEGSLLMVHPASLCICLASTRAVYLSRPFMVESKHEGSASKRKGKGLPKGCLLYIQCKDEDEGDEAYEAMSSEMRASRPGFIVTTRRIAKVRDVFRLRSTPIIRAAQNPSSNQISLKDQDHLSMLPIMIADFAIENWGAVVLLDLLDAYKGVKMRKVTVHIVEELAKIAREHGVTVIIIIGMSTPSRIMRVITSKGSPL